MRHSTPHHYRVEVKWTGNKGDGTSDYRTYGRDHQITGPGKAHAISASSDPLFRGRKENYNPEELLVAALSSCHMLWFLHLCADSGVVVTAYEDYAEGSMQLDPDGSGQFTEVVLRPRVRTAAPVPMEKLSGLHDNAHEKCFIARSVKFAVRCEPVDVKGAA